MPSAVQSTDGRVASWRDWERIGESTDSPGPGGRRFLPQGNPARGWGLNYGDRGIWIPRSLVFARGRAMCQRLAERAPTFTGTAEQRAMIRDLALNLRRERRALARETTGAHADYWLHSALLGRYWSATSAMRRMLFGELWRRLEDARRAE